MAFMRKANFLFRERDQRFIPTKTEVTPEPYGTTSYLGTTASYETASYEPPSYGITSQKIKSYRIIPYGITSYWITSL